MLRLPPDAHAADWIVRGVRDFDCTVGSIVPPVFEAYARVFHPPGRRSGESDAEVRWADVAAANGRVMHPAAEWGSLTGSWRAREQPGVWDMEPELGDIPERIAKHLARLLQRYTSTAERCWFAPTAMREELGVMLVFTEGTSADEQVRVRDASEARLAERQRRLETAPRFTLPNREFRLFAGALEALVDLYDELDVSPNLWWPDDRSWCVGTDIDLMTTYVGGSASAVDALLADKQIEVLPVLHTQSVTWEADTVNPLPWQAEQEPRPADP
jgi:hypothetical protein